jgi:hypothetical protein
LTECLTYYLFKENPNESHFKNDGFCFSDHPVFSSSKPKSFGETAKRRFLAEFFRTSDDSESNRGVQLSGLVRCARARTFG